MDFTKTKPSLQWHSSYKLIVVNYLLPLFLSTKQTPSLFRIRSHISLGALVKGLLIICKQARRRTLLGNFNLAHEAVGVISAPCGNGVVELVHLAGYLSIFEWRRFAPLILETSAVNANQEDSRRNIDASKSWDCILLSCRGRRCQTF